MRKSRLALIPLLLVLACDDGGDAEDGTTVDGGGGTFVDAGDIPCVGLQCQQVVCAGGGTTSISGVVYTPAGNLPIYNATVFVPQSSLAPITQGASCEQCDAQLSGDPLVQTETNTRGEFVLGNMPVGEDIPVVIQVGKWRKQITVASVGECVDTPIDAGDTRLPANQGEGDMPRIALATGGADALECLLRKVGISDSEFTRPEDGGRVSLFRGVGGIDEYEGGDEIDEVNALLGTTSALLAYDVVLLSCDGTENPNNTSYKTLANATNLRDFTSAGGRVFASHWHNYFVEFGPDDWPDIMDYDPRADLNDITADINTGFEKGLALATWLLENGGSSTLGKIALTATQRTIRAIDQTLATQWITTTTPTVQYLSFNTPLGADADDQCGRVVVSDMHVSAEDAPGEPFPSGCETTDLSPQEKALVFMLFDLSSCIEDDIPIGKPTR
jgi:hypothetical protein